MDVIIVSHTELGYAEGKRISYVVNPKHKAEMKRSVISGKKSIEALLSVSRKHGAKVCFALAPDMSEAADNAVIRRIPKEGHEVGLHIHPIDRHLVRSGMSDGRSRDLRDYSYSEQKRMISSGKKAVRKAPTLRSWSSQAEK